jgi:hypothetical protein
MLVRAGLLLLCVGLVLTGPSDALAASRTPAVSGYDAAYFGESAWVQVHPGDPFQLSVTFTNTGAQSWVNGTGSEVDLVICIDIPEPPYYPCNVLSPYGDWSVNWTSTRIYAAPTATVAPGSNAQYVYGLKVPIGTAPGFYYIRGELALRATGMLIHPVGYYVRIQVL